MGSELPGPADTEVHLLARLRAGDSGAFDEIYTRHHARLYAFVARLVGRRDLADDLTQETWLRFARHAPTLRPDTVISAWLFTVGRNLTLSFRRSSALAGGLFSHFGLGARFEARSPAPSPLDHAAASETERRLDEALARLPARYREVLLLVAVEGMSGDEARVVLGLRADAFRQRLSRARAMLEERLARSAAVPPALLMVKP